MDAMILLRENGVDAHYVDGETPDEERRAMFRCLNDGDIDYICNVGVIERGTDIPRIGCVQMCTAVGNVVRWKQMIGRGSRVHPAKTDCCLARGTLILTDRGEVPIEEVKTTDLVWDGVEFCHHDGVCCMGIKPVVQWGKLLLTPDHEVLTNDGWKEASEAKTGGWRPVTGGAGGEPVPVFDYSNPHSSQREAFAGGSGLQGMRRTKLGVLPRPYQEENERLQPLQTKIWATLSRVGMETSATPTTEMPVPANSILRPIWWARDRVSVLFDIRRCLLDSRKPWATSEQVVDNRQDRQQWALRTWEPSMGNEPDSIPQPRFCVESEITSRLPIRDILRHTTEQPKTQGTDSERDCRPMVAEVWDIINCGPRNRYCANGVIVANCVLDHARGIRDHGFFEDDVQWTLEWGERPSKEHGPRETIECPQCGAVYRGGKCASCGYEPKPSERRAQGLEFVGGELREVKRRERNAQKHKTCEQMLIQALFVAGRRGKTFGTAWHIAKTMGEKQGTLFRVPSTFEVAGKRYRSIPYGHPDGKLRVSITYGFTVGRWSDADNPYRIR